MRALSEKRTATVTCLLVYLQGDYQSENRMFWKIAYTNYDVESAFLNQKKR